MRLIRLLLLALLAGCASRPAAAPGLLDGLERRVLPNGLAVVVKEDRRLPTVTAMLAYRVGSVNEPPGLTGVSHFFEHMVFKGTAKYKPGDIDRITYRCGGENNAFTTEDMTGYWFHVHSAHLEPVLDILADTMGHCSLDPKEFDHERNTVIQEMNRWLDGPWGEVERALAKAVHPSGGYGHPVLGWREDVDRLTPEKMREYYKAWYQPNNASLVVVGDVRRDEVFRLAERLFGPIPRGTDAAPPRPLDPPQQAPQTLDLKGERVADRIILAWRADRAGTDTDIILDVVATILGKGRAGRIPRRLVDREELAGEGNVDVSNYSRRHEGIFTVQAELALEAPADKAREVVLEELEALRLAPVGERELRRAKNILRADFAFEVESQYELTSKIGYFEALGLPDYVERYMGRVEAVTAKDIQDCARRIFTERNRTVAVSRAKAKRSGGGPRLCRRRSGQAVPRLGEVTETALPNGLAVVVHRRSEVPVLSLQAFVDAGHLHEPADRAGIARLTGELLDEGVDDGRGRALTAEQLAETVEFVGGQFSAGAQGAEVKVLSDHASVAFDLVRDVLRHPSFPPAEVERRVSDLLAEIESMDDDPEEVCGRLFLETAYRGHPRARPDVGRKETLEKLTRDDVRAWHRRMFRPENAVIVVSGDIDPARAVEELKARLGDWKGEGAWTRPAVPAAKRQAEPRTVFRTYKAQQVRLHLGHVGVERGDPDYFALRVMETILGSGPGFTSRLPKIVRDEQGLAYDIYGTATAGAGAAAGPFQVVLGVEAPDKDRALALVREVLGRFLEEGPTAEEVEDARRYLLSSFVMGWERAEDVAAYLLETKRFGLGRDYAERHHRAVAAATPEEVRRVARKHLDLKALTTVVVGPVDQDGKLLKEGDQPR